MAQAEHLDRQEARAPKGGSLAQWLNRVISWLDSCPLSAAQLFARLSIAAVFWRSGRTKLDGLAMKESTLHLFEHEYQVPILPPEVAAYAATAAEHIFPLLLVIGLAARFSAASLLAMTAVIQVFVYPDAWPAHFLWFSLLFLILVKGPGRVSIDAKIRDRWDRRAGSG